MLDPSNAVVPPITEVDCMERLFPDPLINYSALTEKLSKYNIVLESVCCRGAAIRGMIRVRNLSYEKKVFVRYSFDFWNSSKDCSADFFPIITPSEGHACFDLFEFTIPIPQNLMPGSMMEFCICYSNAKDSGLFRCSL